MAYSDMLVSSTHLQTYFGYNIPSGVSANQLLTYKIINDKYMPVYNNDSIFPGLNNTNCTDTKLRSFKDLYPDGPGIPVGDRMYNIAEFSIGHDENGKYYLWCDVVNIECNKSTVDTNATNFIDVTLPDFNERFRISNSGQLVEESAISEIAQSNSGTGISIDFYGSGQDKIKSELVQYWNAYYNNTSRELVIETTVWRYFIYIGNNYTPSKIDIVRHINV